MAFGGNGVGQTLKIGANKFRIVGVLAAKVSDPDMQQGSDDDCVYLPYTTAMRLSSQSTVNNYAAVMEDEGRANEAKSAVESELQRLLGSDNGYYVYSATNIRLQELTLSYTMPNRWFGNVLKDVTVSFIANNPWMLYCEAPFDPELTPSTATYGQGNDYFMQPSVRSFGFGIKFKL